MFVIDSIYKYQIDQVLEGGMGQVFLLTQNSRPGSSSIENAIYSRATIQDAFGFPYRDKLAAKTVKDISLMRDFERECLIWLGINEIGITPLLLKVTKVNGQIFALMPRYDGNLRSLFGQGGLNGREIIKLLHDPILGLSKVHAKMGFVHQDIKPENFLFTQRENGPSLFISDWGIANLQASLMGKMALPSPRFTFKTMTGFGTLPYMAPERLLNHSSVISFDIFSLGMVFMEALVGNLPYHKMSPVEEQIISGEYYFTARNLLCGLAGKTSSSILAMILPDADKRIQSYTDVLKFIKTI